MTAIDHDVKAILEQMSASMPAPADFDVAAFRAMVEDHPTPPSRITLAAVEDTTIGGAHWPCRDGVARTGASPGDGLAGEGADGRGQRNPFAR